jgi:hypothetical protein
VGKVECVLANLWIRSAIHTIAVVIKREQVCAPSAKNQEPGAFHLAPHVALCLETQGVAAFRQLHGYQLIQAQSRRSFAAVISHIRTSSASRTTWRELVLSLKAGEQSQLTPDQLAVTIESITREGKHTRKSRQLCGSCQVRL